MHDHHPPHLFLDDTWYLITAATLDHARHLAGEESKTIVRDTLRSLVLRFDIRLLAWVILDNHYHLLLRPKHGEALSQLVRQLHGRSSREINLHDKAQGRQIWHNYWDTRVRSESDLWVHVNYVHNNPVKHGYVKDLGAWKFSSYAYYRRTKGEEWLLDCLQRYPVIDFLAGDECAG